MLRHVITMSILALCLAGCSQPNPILGVWEVDASEGSAGSEVAALIAGKGRVEFREDKRVVGGRSVDVSYEVTPDRVIVTETQEGRGVVYRILDENRIQMEMSMGIVVVYRRQGAGPADVASGGAANR